MVFGSHAKTCAMYSTPPGPSLAASTAAYRRRSFSDSQPKNRFIFCSTSAAYTSIPHSLIRHLLWGKDTAAQTIREVIFDHILSFHRVGQYIEESIWQMLRQEERVLLSRIAMSSGLDSASIGRECEE